MNQRARSTGTKTNFGAGGFVNRRGDGLEISEVQFRNSGLNTRDNMGNRLTKPSVTLAGVATLPNNYLHKEIRDSMGMLSDSLKAPIYAWATEEVKVKNYRSSGSPWSYKYVLGDTYRIVMDGGQIQCTVVQTGDSC